MIEFKGKSGNDQPIVAIVMGSDSDWRIMQDAASVLEDANIPYIATVKSAHRMPFEMLDFSSNAIDNGFSCIIAGAGGAAHLPGMLAASTTLPVIGVPVSLKNLDGIDSLLSIVQMPQGVPVATVSIDGAANAALLALRIIGASSTKYCSDIAKYLIEYQKNLNKIAKRKGENLARN